MERRLHDSDLKVRVIEDCLNGRRTAFEDPYNILMLGTNDFQSMHWHNAWHSAQGISALVDAIRRAPIEPGMPVPKILVVSPPPIQVPSGAMAPKFQGAAEKSGGLAEAFEIVARERNCSFFDAGKVVSSSSVDGVHLDAEQHLVLGRALAEVVAPLLLRVEASNGALHRWAAAEGP